MIILYGGSQADEVGRSEPRLPATAVADLSTRLRGLFQSLNPTCLVGALASGADILFAGAALAENISVKVRLPFDQGTFRRTSVENRGEPWTTDYDRLLTNDQVDVNEASFDPDDESSYRSHNLAMLDYAKGLANANGERVWLVTIRPSPQPDSPSITDDFVRRAEEDGILTIDLNPAPGPKSAFVVMPYGKKFDPMLRRYIDCDPTFHHVYRPLLEDFDLKWGRADLATDSGIIHSGMLFDLANADLVLADLSTTNFNVAYELGVRHVFARRSTVLVHPHVTSSKRYDPPFDIAMIRIHSFDRSRDITDEEAEAAIRLLRPIVRHALTSLDIDSPAHDWFELTHLVSPFQRRSEIEQTQLREIDIRRDVAEALRSSKAELMHAQSALVAKETGITESTRRSLRIELATGLMAESEYREAQHLLDLARPQTDDPLHRIWLQQSVMVYRRLGESTTDDSAKAQLWTEAKRLLMEADAAGYVDSETYGIWGGLLKRQLDSQRSRLDPAVAESMLSEIEARYRAGFELDPQFYTGVNLVMAIRCSNRKRTADFERDFNEALTVSRFLTRRAIEEDERDFWALATRAELTLHEALERRTSMEDAVREYADAARYANPDQVRSATFQLEYLRRGGDPGEVIDRVIAVFNQPDWSR
jgi:hypothetical protein